MKRYALAALAAAGIAASVPAVASAHWAARDVLTSYISYAVHYPPTYYPTVTVFQSYGAPNGYVVDVLNQTTGIGQCATFFPAAPIGHRRYFNCFGAVSVNQRRIRVAATATPVPHWIGIYAADHLTY